MRQIPGFSARVAKMPPLRIATVRQSGGATGMRCDGLATSTRISRRLLLSHTINPLPSGVQVSGLKPGTSNDATLAPSADRTFTVTPSSLVIGVIVMASRVPSGEKFKPRRAAKPASKIGTGTAPGFLIQMALVPERSEIKAKVPSGAKVGELVMPLAGSMISGWAIGAGLARARLFRPIWDWIASNPLALADRRLVPVAD